VITSHLVGEPNADVRPQVAIFVRVHLRSSSIVCRRVETRAPSPTDGCATGHSRTCETSQEFVSAVLGAISNPRRWGFDSFAASPAGPARRRLDRPARRLIGGDGC